METTHSYIARTFHGLEGVLQEELEALGASDCLRVNRAVAFNGDQSVLYRVNFRSRLALGVLKPIMENKVFNENQLYKVINDYPWEEIFKTDRTFAIQPIVNSSIFTHSQYAALKTKDAIVDRYRKLFGRRPSVDRDDPDIALVLHIRESKLSISLDSGGEGLFKRGYRQRTGPAPLNEVLAAGIVKLTGWNGETPFIDPMCGSGTLPIEAACIQAGKPAQDTSRKYCFENWPDFNPGIWFKIKREKSKSIGDAPLYGSDKEQRVVQMAMENARAAKVQDHIQFDTLDFFDVKPPAENSTMVINPPYDIRLKEDQIFELYKKIGDHLKQNWAGSSAWIFTVNLEAAKHIGLKPNKKVTLFNGPHEGKLLRFDIY